MKSILQLLTAVKPGDSAIVKESDKISRIRLNYAKANFAEDVYKKIHKSYIVSQISAIVWALGLIALVLTIAFLPLLRNTKGTHKIVTISNNVNAEVTYYLDGTRRVVDLIDFIEKPVNGDQYYITVDNNDNVLSVISYDEYKEEEKNRTMISFVCIMIVCFGGMGLYTYLVRNVFAAVWTKYCTWYREGRTKGVRFEIEEDN